MLKYLSGINTNNMNKRQQLKKAIIRQQMATPLYPTLMEEASFLGKAKRGAVKKAFQKAKQTVKKTAQKAKTAARKVVKTAATVGLAPARAAFLVLIRTNVGGIATKMAQAYKKDKGAVENFWKQLSGNPAELKNIISQGSKQQLSGIGSVAASATAAAAPIVAKALALFAKLGIKPENAKKIIAAGKNALKKAIKNKAAGIRKKKVSVPAENAESTQVAVEQMETPSQVPTSAEKQAGEETAQGTQASDSARTASETGEGKKINPLLIAGAGAAVLAVLALSKRK